MNVLRMLLQCPTDLLRRSKKAICRGCPFILFRDKQGAQYRTTLGWRPPSFAVWAPMTCHADSDLISASGLSFRALDSLSAFRKRSARSACAKSARSGSGGISPRSLYSSLRMMLDRGLCEWYNRPLHSFLLKGYAHVRCNRWITRSGT